MFLQIHLQLFQLLTLCSLCYSTLSNLHLFKLTLFVTNCSFCNCNSNPVLVVLTSIISQRSLFLVYLSLVSSLIEYKDFYLQSNGSCYSLLLDYQLFVVVVLCSCCFIHTQVFIFLPCFSFANERLQ
jgi:hypothetical protein